MVDTSKYKDLFISEAHDRLDSLDAALISFEKKPENIKTSEEIMRHSHTLKGMAAEMGYGELSNLAHSFEGMVENIKNGLTEGNSVEMLFGALDELRRLVDEAEKNDPEIKANPLVDKVGELEESDTKSEEKTISKPELFREIREVKVHTNKLDAMVNLSAELMVNKLRLQETSKKIEGATTSPIIGAIEEHGKLIDELQYQVLQLRLTPLAQVFNRFPRMIRDLSKKVKKDISLEIVGGDIELDRSILEKLGEPLLHLLRNAVDHGIEGKGNIVLSASRDKNRVQIEVRDNGRGIDWGAIKAKKRKDGAQNNSLEDVLFSGVSTAKHVTDISGRGVGLNVVKRKIEEIGGTISVTSTAGEGTSFVMHLPVSLAIIKALIVKVCSDEFAIPVADVDRLLLIEPTAIRKQADQEVVVIGEEDVPLIRLHTLFGLDKKKDETGNANIPKGHMVVLVRIGNRPTGIIVDTTESEQDIIVKPLDFSAKKRRSYFSAVTILGDGKPVPIVDVEGIAESVKI